MWKNIFKRDVGQKNDRKDTQSRGYDSKLSTRNSGMHSMLLALEPRIMFDGALVATGAEIVSEVSTEVSVAAEVIPAEDSNAPPIATDPADLQVVVPVTTLPEVESTEPLQAQEPVPGSGTSQDPAAEILSYEPQVEDESVAIVSSLPESDPATEPTEIVPTENTETPASAPAIVQDEKSASSPLSGLENESPVIAAEDTAAREPVVVAFIDDRVDNYEAIVSSLDSSVKTHVLGSEDAGISVVAEELKSGGQVDTVMIFSHGGQGWFQLGSDTFNDNTLTEKQQEISSWSESLTAEADIQIFGCSVAEGTIGNDFIKHLSDITGADVAASIDASGHETLGGNWFLERTTGTIDNPFLASNELVQGYHSLLAAPSITDNASATRTTAEDTPLAITGVTIADSDDPVAMSAIFAVTGGTLDLVDGGGWTLSAGVDGSASITITGTTGQINSAMNGMVFTPTLNQNSSTAGYAPKIDITVSDTDTPDGPTVGTVNLLVTQMNDAPVIAGGTALEVNEGGNGTFGRVQLAPSDNALDPDIATGQQVIAQQMVSVDSLPTKGTLTYKNGPVVVGSVIPVTDLANLKYTHNGTDLLAVTTDSFSVTVNDGGGGSTAGVVNINVNPVNAAPSISGSPTLIEGQVKVVAPSISLGDSFDTLANSTIVIDNIVDGSQGTLFIDANNNNVVDGGEALAGSTTLGAGQRSNLTSQLKFFQNGAEPNAPGAVSPSYRITVTDAGGGTGVPSAPVSQTITLDVSANNDDPTLTNLHPDIGSALGVGEGNTTVLTAGMLQIADADRNPANLNQTTPENQLVYTIGTRPTQGEIQLNVGGGLGPEGDGWVVLGDGGRFTQADVAAGKLRYYQTTNVNDAPDVTTDSFTFTVRDSAFGYDVWTDPANPTSPREGGLRDTPTGAIATQAFFMTVSPLPAPGSPRTVAYEGDPRDPTAGYSSGGNVSYVFAPGAMTNGNSAAVWNEANVGSAGGYIVTNTMLDYTISRVDNLGTPEAGDDVTVTVPADETVYTMTSPPPNGTLQHFSGGSWMTVVTNGQFTQDDIDNNLIRFVHDGSENHTATFGYKVSDGTPNVYTSSFALNITPTNDRPTGNGGTVQVVEKSLDVDAANTGLVRLGTSALGMSDVDLSQDVTKQVNEGAQDFLWFTVNTQPQDSGATQHGELQRWNGAAWVTVTPGEWLPSTLLTDTPDGGTSGLRYAHDASEPLAYPTAPQVTFTYAVRDDLANPGNPYATSSAAVPDASGSAQSNQSANATTTIKIIPVNNAPAVADKPGDVDPVIGSTITSGGALTGVNEILADVPEGATAVITSAFLTAVDQDNTTVQRQYKLTDSVDLGTLYLSGKALGVGSTFTQDDIDNNRLTYVQNGGEVGAATTDSLGTYHDKFHFTVSDGVFTDSGAGATNYNTFLITLKPANDPPTITAPSTLDVMAAGNTPVAVPGLSVDDPDLAAISGTEEDFVRVEVQVLNAADALVAGSALTYSAADPTAGGRNFVSGKTTNSLVLQGTKAEVNAALASLTVAFTNDEDSSTHKIRVTVDDRLYTSGGVIDPAGGANGGTDAVNNSNGTPINDTNNRVIKNIALRVSNANDAPTFTNATTYSVNEDSTVTLTGYSLADVDSFNSDVTVVLELFSDVGLTTLANATTQGRLQTGTTTGLTTASGNNSNTITLTGSIAEVQSALNTLKVEGRNDFNNGPLYVKATLTDYSHAGGANTVTISNQVDVVPVNDAPTLTVPANKALSSGTSISINGFAVGDTKDISQGANDYVEVTIKAEEKGTANLYGTLDFTASGAATLTNDNTSTVVIKGTTADVQATLNSLVYTPVDANVDKSITITTTVDDRNGGDGNGKEVTGVDGNNTITRTFDIAVSNTNDPPVVTVPATLSVAEDSTANAVAGVSFADSDGFDYTEQVTLSVAHGRIDLTTRTGLTVTGGAYNSATVTVTGTKTNLNNALATLKYTPTGNYHGPDTLAMSVSDLGNVGVGAVGTDSENIAITVTPVNDQPTATTNVTLAAIAEDTGSPATYTLSSLAFTYSDTTDNQVANGGNSTETAFSYLAVVGDTNYTAAQGSWQVSDGAGDWITIPDSGLSTAAALIFPSSREIRFVPAADFHGTPGTLNVRLADNNVDLSGTGKISTDAGQKFNITQAVHGGTGTTGAWNAVNRTIGTTVTNVNDRPTGTATTLTATNEDTANPAGASVSSLGFGYKDNVDNQGASTGNAWENAGAGITGGANAATSFGGIAIVGNAADATTEGVWQYNNGGGWQTIGSGGSSPTDSGALLLPTTATIRFLPNVANYNGTPGNLTVRVADTAVGFSTGSDISATLAAQTSTWSTATTLGTTVNPQNDAPTISGTATAGAAATFTEGGAAAALITGATGGAADIDLPGSVTFGSGTLTVTLDNYRPGDLLSLAGTPTGVASTTGGSAAQLVINLNTSATPANLGAILEAIRFSSTSNDPTVLGTDTDRAWTITLNDGNNVNGAANAGGPTALNSNQLTGTLTVVGVNDPPVAVDDTNTITEDAAPGNVSGNVKTGVGGTLDSDPDNTNGQLSITSIRTGTEAAGGAMTTVTGGTTSANGTSITGMYGTIVLGADGSYTYTLNNNNAAVNALKNGQSLTEYFSYTLSDSEPLSDVAQITITIAGATDAAPAIGADDGNGAATGQATVSEAGLTTVADTSEMTTGTLTVTAADGIASVSIGGTSFTYAQLAGFTPASPSATIDTGEGLLKVTGFTATSSVGGVATGGTVNYTYTLKTNINQVAATESTDAIILTVTDAGGTTSAPGTLTVQIVDDTPTAQADEKSISRGTPSVTGNVIASGSGGDVADRIGADTTATPVTEFGFGAPTGTVAGNNLAGNYGSLLLEADGSYTYTLNNANVDVIALSPGATLTEVFSYTMTDADGDTSVTNLTITIVAPIPPAPPAPPVPPPIEVVTTPPKPPGSTSSGTGGTSPVNEQDNNPQVPVFGGDPNNVASNPQFSPLVFGTLGELPGSDLPSERGPFTLGLSNFFSLAGNRDGGFPELFLVGRAEDKVIQAEIEQNFAVPPDIFQHTDPSESLTFSAKKASGEPLPDWLKFDSANLTFHGTPPPGEQQIGVMIIARDSVMREAKAFFTIRVQREIEDGDNRLQRETYTGFDNLELIGLKVKYELQIGETRVFQLQKLFVNDEGEAKDIRFEKVTLRDGSPVPAWIKVDLEGGKVTAILPPGVEGSEIVIIGTDPFGNSAEAVIVLEAGNDTQTLNWELPDSAGYSGLSASLDAVGINGMQQETATFLQSLAQISA